MGNFFAPIKNFRTAADLISSIIQLNKDVAVKEKAIELQSTILSLQSDMSLVQQEKDDLIEIKRNLERKLTDLEQWENTKSQYRLTEVSQMVFVYAPIDPEKMGEPMHWLCSNCFQDRQKSILQSKYMTITLFCPRCKAEIAVPEE